jgi:uncharacterized alpha-E superfamily protein
MKSTNILATLDTYVPNNTRSYGTKRNTWKYLQVETTNLLALYKMIMPKSILYKVQQIQSFLAILPLKITKRHNGYRSAISYCSPLQPEAKLGQNEQHWDRCTTKLAM